MRLRTILILLSGTLLLAACNSTDKGNELALAKGATVNHHFGSCDTITNHGVEVLADLWQPADSGAAARSIRDLIIQKAIERINSHADSVSIAANPLAKKSIKGAFEVFEKNYLDFRKTVPDAPGCWEIELKGDTVMVTPKVLFYQLNHYAFTGGAHPNGFLSYHAFDEKTGSEMQVKHFIADSVALLSLVEKKFRETEQLTPEADLENEGYFLINHKFFLPANYVFTREGVLFYYNPYEIAAYVRGPIEFTIYYSDLKDIIKKELVF